MEKESLIKVGVLSLVILAVAIPILTTCMAGLQKDGQEEAYDIPVKGDPDPETGSDNINPLSARDMMEYAKERGATSWKVEYEHWTVYSITLYKGSRIIEEKIYEDDSHGGWKGKFIYDTGYSEVTYHSATSYMTFAQEEYAGGTYGHQVTGNKFVISCEGRNGTIEVYSSFGDTTPIFTKNVKMIHAWIPAGSEYNPDDGFTYYEQWNWVYLDQVSPSDYQPKFINYDDIHWIGYIHGDYVYLHGDELIGYIDGVLTEGTVSYEYTEEEDSPVKTLTAIHMSYNGYNLDITERFDTITPAHLVYKEPYVGPTLGAMLSIIPIVALAGIGLYLFHKFKSNEE